MGKPSFSSFFLLLFPYKEHTREAHAEGERKQQQQDDVSVPDLYLLWRKTSQGQGLPCPGISPAKQTVPAAPDLGCCGDLSPQSHWQGHARSACLDTSVSSLSVYRALGKRSNPNLSRLFFFFFSLSVLKAEQREAPGMLKPLLNLVSLLPQGNTPQSHHLLPAYLCTLFVGTLRLQMHWGRDRHSALGTYRACSVPSC